MKNTAVQFFVFPDSHAEIVDDITREDVLDQIYKVKKMVTLNLTLEEYNEYMSKDLAQKELYIRNKWLQLIQK